MKQNKSASLLALCLMAVLLVVASADRHRVGFKKNCRINNDCKKGLTCDVRTEPISFTCLVAFGGLCSRDTDCVNNLNCMSGRCACESNSFYDEEKNDCFKQQTFGEVCEEDKQCAGHLICSKQGLLQNVCLQDYGEACSDNNDCGNNQLCLNGKCGCNNRYQKYNQLTHDCDLYKLDGEDKVCTTNADCYHNMDLACDVGKTGAKTSKCKRTIDVFCNSNDDCANGQKCVSNWCNCYDDGRYFNYSTKECLAQKEFKEACIENRECGANLVCDVRVQPTPISSNRFYTCLKTYGVQCKNNSECVNYLPCVDGKCGCRPNYFYNEDLNDCFPQQEFGAKCSSNAQCKSGLGCDLSASGDQSKTCTYLPGAKCSSYSDCTNNVDCIRGVCRCPSHSKYDEDEYLCRPRRSDDDEEEDSREHIHHSHSHERHSRENQQVPPKTN